MFFYWSAVGFTILFVIQFILSLFLGDLDIDLGGGDSFDLGGLISFKGIIHFALGFCWTMWFSRDLYVLWGVLISLLVGLVFMFLLWVIYRASRKLEHSVTPEEGEELVGRKVKLYLRVGPNQWKAYVTRNGQQTLIEVSSEDPEEIKDFGIYTIKSYNNNIYYIL